ncbi:complement C1q tumor necrosis factor-related protein 6-like isoform X2 [Callorhinchus milii]|nr:complement C1q tumor necrosis factor-related protein 6-like isoform X2 [Callorhinchus milii]
MVAGGFLSQLLLLVVLRPWGVAVPSEGGPQRCVRCCDPYPGPPSAASSPPPSPAVGTYPAYPRPHIHPHINITILKGEKGDRGERGSYGKLGKAGAVGLRGPPGLKGSRGQVGATGSPCKQQHSAFSVGRRKGLHSSDYYRALVFDTVFVNLRQDFNMFKGRFYCSVPGVYFFNLNVHTWNFKETYLHLMRNEQEVAICYAQPSERSVMQSQSVMLALAPGDQVWVRLYKRERENAVYSDDVDTYITFNGYLVKADDD